MSAEREAARVLALRRYAILDSGAEQAYDDITVLAAYICESPISLVSFVDVHRQWFKSKFGLDASETPRVQAFCAHTIQQHGTLVIEDATRDERFSDNPLVVDEPGIRFYAGAPLITPDGYSLGTLCVIDRHPRKLAPHQQRALEVLSRVVISHLEARRVSAELATVIADRKVVAGLLPMCSYCKKIRNDTGYWEQVEAYIEANSDMQLSHGMCPTCAKQHFPDFFARKKAAGETIT